MKTIWLSILFSLLISTPLFSQFIAIQNGDRVEVRDIKGGYMTSGYYSGLKDVSQGENIIVLLYKSGKVEVRDDRLRYLSSWFQ